MQGSLNVSVVNMRLLNPRLLNPSLLNSCFTAGELAPLAVGVNQGLRSAVRCSAMAVLWRCVTQYSTVWRRVVQCDAV